MSLSEPSSLPQPSPSPFDGIFVVLDDDSDEDDDEPGRDRTVAVPRHRRRANSIDGTFVVPDDECDEGDDEGTEADEDDEQEAEVQRVSNQLTHGGLSRAPSGHGRTAVPRHCCRTIDGIFVVPDDVGTPLSLRVISELPNNFPFHPGATNGQVFDSENYTMAFQHQEHEQGQEQGGDMEREFLEIDTDAAEPPIPARYLCHSPSAKGRRGQPKSQPPKIQHQSESILTSLIYVSPDPFLVLPTCQNPTLHLGMPTMKGPTTWTLTLRGRVFFEIRFSLTFHFNFFSYLFQCYC